MDNLSGSAKWTVDDENVSKVKNVDIVKTGPTVLEDELIDEIKLISLNINLLEASLRKNNISNVHYGDMYIFAQSLKKSNEKLLNSLNITV